MYILVTQGKVNICGNYYEVPVKLIIKDSKWGKFISEAYHETTLNTGKKAWWRDWKNSIKVDMTLDQVIANSVYVEKESDFIESDTSQMESIFNSVYNVVKDA